VSVASDEVGERGEPELVRVRVRLPGRIGFLYMIRQFNALVDPDRFPGAEPLLSRGGRILAAPGPRRLIELNECEHMLDGALRSKTLVVDVRRAARAVQRPAHRWSAHTRGSLIEFDDICWDAAATLGDEAWAASVRDPAGTHALYAFVWQETSTLPGPAERSQLLADLTAALLARMEIIE
jgi:hypothetical protein